MTQAEVSDHILAAYAIRDANEALRELLAHDRLHGTLGDAKEAVQSVSGKLNLLYVDHIAAVYGAINKPEGNGTDPKPLGWIAA